MGAASSFVATERDAVLNCALGATINDADAIATRAAITVNAPNQQLAFSGSASWSATASLTIVAGVLDVSAGTSLTVSDATSGVGSITATHATVDGTVAAARLSWVGTSLTVGTGGSVNADGLSALDTGLPYNTYSGASHGAKASGTNTRAAYGNPLQPVTLGSVGYVLSQYGTLSLL